MADWSYSMRRDMQEILPGIYLGPYAAAMKSKLLALQQNGISHIVCIRQAIEAHFVRPNFPDMFEYLVLDVADTVTENIIRYFPKVREFVDKALKSGGKVLIHGNAGISRSGALMIAYVMEKHGLSYKEAYSYVQQRRFCVNPNEGFAQQLMEYEPIYKARMCQGLVQFCGNAEFSYNAVLTIKIDVRLTYPRLPLTLEALQYMLTPGDLKRKCPYESEEENQDTGVS